MPEFGGVNAAAYESLFELLEHSHLHEVAIAAVLAAADGAQALAALLDGEQPSAAPERSHAPDSEAARVYLEQVAVEGFRGIGERARLQFEPGPGLTLIVGRNGCGKSSFAEALEVLLTGTTLRWEERTRVWREGWRSLHHGGSTTISATFRVDGEAEPLTLSRRWPAGAALETGEALTVTGPRSSWSELRWERPLEQFRPILSYNELGTMFSTRAAALYEALSAVLGLEEFDAVLAALRQERLSREKSGKAEKQVRQDTLQLLTASRDVRGPLLVQHLSQPHPDVDAVWKLVESKALAQPETDSHALATLSIPTEQRIETVFVSATSAQQTMVDLQTDDVQRMDALAQLLEVGLAFHRAHAETLSDECPLCGTANALDEGWASRSEVAAHDLRERSRGLREARAAVERAVEDARTLFSSQTAGVLDRASEAGTDTENARAAWSEYTALVSNGLAQLLQRGEEAARSLAAALSDARAAAAAAQDEQARHWRPVQEALAAWTAAARRAERDKALVVVLKAAEAWMRDTVAELRRERLAPVVDGAKENWDELRHESNVSLGGVELRKQGNQRYAAFDVSIDGDDASAFGVMSQGELSALAISVFLPRAMLPGSPFAFMVIDDPVQSMDPAKVDGLARVLGRAAEQRQVIVFTHDERLPEAVRSLDIAARVMRVQRRARSKVEIVAARPPSDRYIGEAFAIAKADTLLDEVRARVIPGFCRSAIEAACATRIRRRLLAAGTRHAAIDEHLAAITSLNGYLADALELGISQGHEIRDAIRRLGGEEAVQAADAARRGAHQLVAVDGVGLVEGAKRLVRALEDPAR